MVTPDAVKAVIEVKTKLEGADYNAALKKLAAVRAMCHGTSKLWTGLFVYESNATDHKLVLKSLRDAHATAFVDGVAIGPNDFFLRWRDIEMKNGPKGASDFWRSYKIDKLAPAYFLGNLIFSLAGRQEGFSGSYAWFPLRGSGKENFKVCQIAPGREPEDVEITKADLFDVVSAASATV
jgi:hypothetical protein